MKSSVLFIIFKREDTTRRVFERIREAQPPRLYIAADGPRMDRLDEIEKCKAARKVVETVDWPCEVHRLYRDENLGCGKGVCSAITWFFEHEEQGIIIEDDILPHLDFFFYCDEMLELYKDDESIQLIAGRNAFYNGYKSDSSYYKSSLFHIWGWATWKRVWDTYEYSIVNISNNFFNNKLSLRVLPLKAKRYWKDVFTMMQEKPIDTWDFQLFFNEVLYDRYSIIPFVNMVQNIGFDSNDATHTKGSFIRESSFMSKSPLPIIHPAIIEMNIKADEIFCINFGFVKHSFLKILSAKFKGGVIRMVSFIQKAYSAIF